MKKQSLDPNMLKVVTDKRSTLEKEFHVVNGRIYSPGKFEMELLYVPYYWQEFLEGMADSDNGSIISFRITPEEKAVFPEINPRKRVMRLLERTDGFVIEV